MPYPHLPTQKERDAPVVLCSQLPNNPVMSVSKAAEVIAAEVISFHHLAVPVWVEHYPPEATDRHSETFDLARVHEYKTARTPVPRPAFRRSTRGASNYHTPMDT